mgnify:CR=1 FL=1
MQGKCWLLPHKWSNQWKQSQDPPEHKYQTLPMQFLILQIAL